MALWQWLRAVSRLRRLAVAVVQVVSVVTVIPAIWVQMEAVAVMEVTLLLIVCGAVVLRQ